MGESFSSSEEEWQKHLEFMKGTLEQRRRDNVDSRTLCGQLDRGWVRWSAERRTQQRQLVRDLWEVGSAGVPRDSKAMFIGGVDSGEKLRELVGDTFGLDPNEYFIVDAYFVEMSMTMRGMSIRIDGLSPLEASWLIREEACELSERLAQLAFAESCNLLFMLNTAYMADGPGFLRERSGSEDMRRRYSVPSEESPETIRTIIYRHLTGKANFDEMVEALVERWRTRPAKPVVPLTWQEIFNRAEEKRDDDDLYWISVAEDLGFLTVDEAERIFAAIELAADPGHEANADGAQFQEDPNARWEHFRARDETLIRVTVPDAPHRRIERYWGARAGWIPVIPACHDWYDEVRSYKQYTPIDEAEAVAIQRELDTRSGGVFRLGQFWPDEADRWSATKIAERIAELEATTNDIFMYWTWQEYQADLDELTRLRTFLESVQNDRPAHG